MNDGVRILLERMETHPEEFDAMGRDSKWENLVYKFNEWLDEEDKEAFKNAIKKMRQQKFTELVLEELVDPKKSSLEDVINQYRVKGMPSVGQTQLSSTGQSQFSNTNGLYPNGIGGNANYQKAQQMQIEHIKAHVEALQQEYADVFNKPKKEHKTIFGKLFNYS
jgi:hypothetical protein